MFLIKDVLAREHMSKENNMKFIPSRIGMGGEQLGGHGWYGLSVAELEKAVDKALECGINFFDTAPIYGLGRSEELLGRILSTRRKGVFVSTKVGLRWNRKGTFQKYTDSSPLNIGKEIDASLRRLNADYIDLYSIHWPDYKTPIGDTMVALDQLVKAGKVGAIGCCNFPLHFLKEALKYCKIAAIQAPYNLIDKGVEKDLLPFCRQNGIHIIAYAPIAKGLLACGYNADSKFGTEDNRNRHPYFLGQAMLDNLKVAERVRVVAGRLGRTPAQVALRWVLANPNIGTALVGVKNAFQVVENVGALGLNLGQEDIKFLQEGGKDGA